MPKQSFSKEAPFDPANFVGYYLVKNVAEKAPKSPSKFHKVLALATTGGMLYALLSGLKKPS